MDPLTRVSSSIPYPPKLNALLDDVKIHSDDDDERRGKRKQAANKTFPLSTPLDASLSFYVILRKASPEALTMCKVHCVE